MQEVPNPGPDPFQRGDMHLTDSTPVIVAGPLPLTRRVTDRGVVASQFGKVIISTPFISVNGRICYCRRCHDILQCLPIGIVHDLKASLARLPTHHSDHRGAVVLHRPVALPLVGTPPRRIVRVEMRNDLFSGGLIHLIGFHFPVFQGLSIQAGFRHCLIIMSQFEQVSSTATQLPSELRGGHTLGETSDDQDQGRGAVMRPLERGPGPSVEDPSARRAAIVEDGFSNVAVEGESVLSLTAGAMQPLGMEQAEEEPEAGILIHKGLDRKVHSWGSSNTKWHTLLKQSREPHRMSSAGQYRFKPMSQSLLDEAVGRVTGVAARSRRRALWRRRA